MTEFEIKDEDLASLKGTVAVVTGIHQDHSHNNVLPKLMDDK